jgi:hypothetical protein
VFGDHDAVVLAFDLVDHFGQVVSDVLEGHLRIY